jgi:hypothetical protein
VRKWPSARISSPVTLVFAAEHRKTIRLATSRASLAGPIAAALVTCSSTCGGSSRFVAALLSADPYVEQAGKERRWVPALAGQLPVPGPLAQGRAWVRLSVAVVGVAVDRVTQESIGGIAQ